MLRYWQLDSCGDRDSEENYKSSDGTEQVQSKIDGLLLLLGTKKIDCVWRGHYCIGGFFFLLLLLPGILL